MSKEEVFVECKGIVEDYLRSQVRFGKNKDARVENVRILGNAVLCVRIVGLIEVNTNYMCKDMEAYFSEKYDPRFFQGMYVTSYIGNSSMIREIRLSLHYYRNKKDSDVKIASDHETERNTDTTIYAQYVWNAFAVVLIILILVKIMKEATNVTGTGMGTGSTTNEL